MAESSSPVSTLRSLLRTYDATTDEVEAVVAILELLDDGPRTFAADYFVPGHVTASAFVVDRTHSRLLLIHHRKLDRWMQPGGHVDAGEDVLTAAIREVQEETGVVATPLRSGIFDLDVHSIPAHGDQPAHRHYDVRFLLETTSDEVVLTDEVLGVRWVPFASVATMDTDGSVVRAAGKLRRNSGEDSRLS